MEGNKKLHEELFKDFDSVLSKLDDAKEHIRYAKEQLEKSEEILKSVQNKTKEIISE